MKAEDLKNSILQLAMQGKLVPQDSNDEPASVLLDKIKKEKEQLVKDKKLKRNNKESVIFKKDGHYYEKIGKKEPVCIDDEIPFDISDSWEWCRFGNVVDFSLGKTPPRKEPIFWDDANIPWVSISDMIDGKIINFTKENVNDYALENSFKGNIVPKNTLLMSFKLTVGKVSILGMDAVHNEAIISIIPYVDDNYAFRDYLFNVLPLVSRTGDTKSAIKGKTLNSKSLNRLLIPLPPLNEQRRISDKIKMFLPLIDEYGSNEEQLIKLNKEFPTKLKSSILQEAVQGKLIPQDPHDEPASVLLENIKQEKEQLIKAKKIKKNNKESVIYQENGNYYEKVGKKEPFCIDDEIPFDIPESWEWCTLGNILSVKGGKRVPKGYKLLDEPTDHIYIRVTNMKNGTIIKDNLKYIDNDIYEQIKNYTINKEDLYMTVAGTIGNVGVVPDYFDGMNLTENANKLTDIQIDKNFLKYVLTSNYIQNQLVDKTTKVAQPKLAIKRILSTKIAIPPLNEQKRIVDNLNQIFGAINSIK